MSGLYRVRVSSLAGIDCPRRIAIQLLNSRLGIADDIPFNGYLLAGNIIHKIVQKIFGRDNRIELVNYYHYRKELSLEDAILAAMDKCLEEWSSLVTSEKYPYVTHSDDISLALNRSEEQLPFLADFSKSLCYIDVEGIQSKAFADEFIVQTILSDYLLVGHIDLVAMEKNSFRLIEIKTGRRKKMDEVQLQLYGDVIHQANPDLELDLEIWYTKTGRLSKITNTKGKTLQHIQEMTLQTGKISSKEDLLSPNKKAEDCYYCNLCDSDNELF